MNIRINHRQVLNNLIRFKESLEDSPKEKQGSATGSRIYKILINKHSGDMTFSKKISSLESHFSSRREQRSLADWKEINLIVTDTRDHKVQFKILDMSNNALTKSDLDPLAWGISQETLQVLNKQGQAIQSIHPETLPEEAALQNLSSIHLAKLGENIEGLPGWAGHLSRIEAEKKLNGQPPGTFLIREADSITDLSIPFLSSSNHNFLINPYVLTVVESSRKIAEHLILHVVEKGWILYTDDPQLDSYTFYSSPQDLFHSLKPMANYPIKI